MINNIDISYTFEYIYSIYIYIYIHRESYFSCHLVNSNYTLSFYSIIRDIQQNNNDPAAADKCYLS